MFKKLHYCYGRSSLSSMRNFSWTYQLINWIKPSILCQWGDMANIKSYCELRKVLTPFTPPSPDDHCVFAHTTAVFSIYCLIRLTSYCFALFGLFSMSWFDVKGFSRLFCSSVQARFVSSEIKQIKLPWKSPEADFTPKFHCLIITYWRRKCSWCNILLRWLILQK